MISSCLSDTLMLLYFSQVFLNFVSSVDLSSYELTTDEKLALSNGLEQHIPSQLNKNDIQTEFECFYQDILKNVPSLTEDEKSTLKTKLRNTCEKYSNIKVSDKQEDIINKLTNNEQIPVSYTHLTLPTILLV